MKDNLSRKQFISKTALTVGATFVLPRFSIGQSREVANNKLNVALIGVGNMGTMAVGASSKQNIIAFADVDDLMAQGAREKIPSAPHYRDFRKMLDRHHKEIDVVLVSTPDHTHFPAAIAAMETGKHVFVQKPLTHDIWQARTLQKAAKHYGVQTIMGNQGRCSNGIRQIKEWYDAGLLGQVAEVHAWTERPYAKWVIPFDQNPPPRQAIPSTFSWDYWQGPVLERDYNECYAPKRWRGWWDYGNASIGDIGCHLLDSTYWALDLTGPVSVKAEAAQFHDQITPPDGIVTFKYPARGDKIPVTVKWYEGGLKPEMPEGFDFGTELPKEGILIKGSKNTIYHSGIRPDNPLILMSRKDWSEFRKTSLPPQTIPRLKHAHPISELFSAIRGGPQPGSNFDYAAPLTELCSLGAIARRTGKQLDFDSKAMSFKDKRLNRYLKAEVRKGWEYGKSLWRV